MIHHVRADDVKIDGDERGWRLIVETDEGDHFDFGIHHLAWDLAKHVDDTIGAWRREGEDARATYVPPTTEEDLDAYPLGDPKRISLEREMNR